MNHYLSDCLDIYYKYLVISFVVLVLVKMLKNYFIHDEYTKFYGSSPNINIEQDIFSIRAPISQIDKC